MKQRGRLARFAVALGVAALACTAPAPGSRVRVEKEFRLSEWRRAEVAGLTLLTNAPERPAEQVAKRLGRFAQLLEQVMGEDQFPPGTRRIVFLFATDREFALYGGGARRVLGHTKPSEGAVRVGMSAELGLMTLPVLYHELVHVALFADERMDYPSWYHEGLAEMLSSASVRENVAMLGAVSGLRVDALHRTEPLPLERIFTVESTWELEPDERARFYADSWALVRLLHGGLGVGGPNYRPALGTFLGRLGAGEAWQAAFESSFPVPLTELEKQFQAVRDQAVHGATPMVRLTLEPALEAPVFEPISDRDAALALATYAEALGAPGLALAFYDELLGEDAQDSEAHTGRSRVLERLDEAAEEDPEEEPPGS